MSVLYKGLNFRCDFVELGKCYLVGATGYIVVDKKECTFKEAK